MTDDHTRVMRRPETDEAVEAFFRRHRASIVIVSGGAEGMEFPLDRPSLSLGRGPGVDLTFDDSSMSRRHAALELGESGFQIRDLGSTNGVRVNGSTVSQAALKHGDRFQLGEYVFQYVLEECDATPATYTVPEV